VDGKTGVESAERRLSSQDAGAAKNTANMTK
jgi:hypothetical protein